MVTAHEHCGRWWVVSNGADIDEAYDLAVVAAADAWGSGHALLSSVPDEMVVQGGVRTEMGAGRMARTAPVGAAGLAVAFAADRFFSRRRANVRVDDASVELGVDGDVEHVFVDIDDEVALSLGEGTELFAGEVVDGVEIRRLRCRYNVAVRRGGGAQQRVFVARVVDGHGRGAIIGTGATAAMARREAMSAMRVELGGAQRYVVEIYGEVRREDGPHLVLERRRVAQRGSVRIHLSSEKDRERTKVAGWVFAGEFGPERGRAAPEEEPTGP